MTTPADIIATATSQLGYVEGGGSGHDGNITKYWAALEPGLQGQPWCAAFVSWVFRTAGCPLPKMGKSYGYVYCPSGVAYARSHGILDQGGRYSPGDIIFFGAGGGTHTGIVVSDNGVTVTTIEGNTSPEGSGGSQSNGGGVYLRKRPHGSWVFGVMKTAKLLAASGPTTPPVVVVPHVPPVVPHVPPTKHSSHDVALTRRVQTAVHVTADGAWGAETMHGALVVIHRTTSDVRYLQARVGTRVDGAWGPASEAARVATVKRLQAAIGVTADGAWGPRSAAAWAGAVAANLGKA